MLCVAVLAVLLPVAGPSPAGAAAGGGFDLAAGNRRPKGIWSNGDTIWVADYSDEKIYAYALADGARRAHRDIDTLRAAGNRHPRGIWSDNDTIWVADSLDNKIYAYALADGARKPALDIDASHETEDRNPYGIWSNGDTMWVLDNHNLRINTHPATTATAATTEAQAQNDDSDQAVGVAGFDPGAGHTVLAAARITAGREGRKSDPNADRAWWAADTAAWHASDEITEGSLAWGDFTLTRVVYFAGTDTLRFNSAADADLGASFAEGGANRELTVWVQTDGDPASFAAKNHIANHGETWINFEVPQEAKAILDAVAVGDTIIIAVTEPASQQAGQSEQGKQPRGNQPEPPDNLAHIRQYNPATAAPEDSPAPSQNIRPAENKPSTSTRPSQRLSQPPEKPMNTAKWLPEYASNGEDC